MIHESLFVVRFFFFFSSRRRHTRCLSDWSSDVCSSDLAAERLLVSIGYADVSVRRLAEEAGANHGLVHYYFGSMEELFLRVLERFTDRLIERQRAMYAADVPDRKSVV